MRYYRRICIAVLVASSWATAGPLFDDYLNYVRPGPGTEPGNATAEVTASKPLGQVITLDKSVGEIYRIGLRPVYETWAPGETVTLTLYDKPQRGTKLASYDIEEATSHVQAIHDTKDRVLYWHLRAPTKGRTQFYFELTASGGDGKVAFQSLAGKGLSHVVHIKPVADREANLRKFFTERLNVDRPELAAVKKAVQATDWEKAIAETAMHFHNRQELWADYSAVLQEKPRLDADTELADLVLKNQLRHVETKKPVPWRAEDYWIPEFKTERAQPKQGAEPNLYTWHVDRFLTAAYTNTAKPEYARRAIDLRMQFILDNPNPKLTGVPWYFELWNDRTAAARAPGHGLLPYVRLYKYDGWTSDERLVFFSFLEDNARWDYKADSGANWGAEAARSCYEFGLKFPEWKMSSEYVSWGTSRLAEIVLGDVRGDGTSTEAAVKYHAMVARRLKGMLEDHVQGRIRLEDQLLERLLKTVEGMYEHMAYTLMPNSFVVMCGDSWYENFAYKPTVSIEDLEAPQRTILKFAKSQDAFSKHLRNKIASLSSEARASMAEQLRLVDAYTGTQTPSDDVKRAFTAILNKLIAPGIANPNEPKPEQITEEQAWLFDQQALAGVNLRPQTRNLLLTHPTGSNRELLSRMLIEDAWPGEIRAGYKSGELYDAAQLVKRPDLVWIASQGAEGRPPAQVSKSFPGGGYFIMRSDFDGREFRDARQLFIHNGNWFGSHGHWDLTSVNLYAYGRPLIIDPGQYEHNPPAGISHYWESKIHSMLVPNGKDCERRAGPSEWVSNAVIDWFDGQHDGYRKSGQIEYVRRRIAFIKPDYFVIDDSVKATAEAEWAQCWNLADPEAVSEENGGTIATTFKQGGNVLILNQRPERLSVEMAEGKTSAGDAIPKTRIIRLKEKTANPRFQTLLYPYQESVRPKIDWTVQKPDTKQSDLVYAMHVSNGKNQDWLAFGQPGKKIKFAQGKNEIDAEFASVRRAEDNQVASFSWADGEMLSLDGQLLAAADGPVHALGVIRRGDALLVEAPEPESTLRVQAGECRQFVLNGKPVTQPIVKDGMFWPFADQPRAIVADNRDAFERMTKGEEWEIKTDPGAWSGTYVQHETDPGRHESGQYVLDVPAAGKYRVEVCLPTITTTPSDRVEYRIIGEGKPAEAGGPIVSVRSASRTHTIMVNQQTMAGWVALGEFSLNKGKLRILSKNATEVDGVYFIADAVRIVPLN